MSRERRNRRRRRRRRGVTSVAVTCDDLQQVALVERLQRPEVVRLRLEVVGVRGDVDDVAKRVQLLLGNLDRLLETSRWLIL